jgi:cytoskeletal protein CcmA (bactofilin family)
MTGIAAAATAVKSNPAADGHEASESHIDKDSHFNGLYETKQNLRIEGLAEGEIRCEGTLTVAQGARVKAKVTASTITIAGELDGEVLCHGVFQIMPSGEVSASVQARRLIVQEGGLYNGQFQMITNGEKAGSLSGGHSVHDSKNGSSESLALDSLSTDEWWRKLTSSDGQEHEAPETSSSDTSA